MNLFTSFVFRFTLALALSLSPSYFYSVLFGLTRCRFFTFFAVSGYILVSIGSVRSSGHAQLVQTHLKWVLRVLVDDKINNTWRCCYDHTIESLDRWIGNRPDRWPLSKIVHYFEHKCAWERAHVYSVSIVWCGDNLGTHDFGQCCDRRPTGLANKFEKPVKCPARSIADSPDAIRKRIKIH